jgi:hypothetical protein
VDAVLAVAETTPLLRYRLRLVRLRELQTWTSETAREEALTAMKAVRLLCRETRCARTETHLRRTAEARLADFQTWSDGIADRSTQFHRSDALLRRQMRSAGSKRLTISHAGFVAPDSSIDPRPKAGERDR